MMEKYNEVAWIYYKRNKINMENQAKYFGWDCPNDAHVWEFKMREKYGVNDEGSHSHDNVEVQS